MVKAGVYIMIIDGLVDRKNQAPMVVLNGLKKGDIVELRREEALVKVYHRTLYLGTVPDKYERAIIINIERLVTMNFELRCATLEEVNKHEQIQNEEMERFRGKYRKYQTEKDSDKYRPSFDSGVSKYYSELDKELTWDYDPE